MVERHALGPYSVEVTRRSGITVEAAIRQDLRIPQSRGPFWNRKQIGLPFETSPLHFERVNTIIYTDGQTACHGLCYGSKGEENPYLSFKKKDFKDCVAVARSNGRQFLLRGTRELLSGEYSDIKVVGQSGDLKNLIVIVEAADHKELRLFNRDGEVSTDLTNDYQAIECFDKDPQTLKTTLVTTGKAGRQSLVFVDEFGQVTALSDKTRITRLITGTSDLRTAFLWASTEVGKTSFDSLYLDLTDGLIRHSFDLAEELDLSKVAVRRIVSREPLDVFWTIETADKKINVYRSQEILVKDAVEFTLAPHSESWVAVTKSAEGENTVVLNGQPRHKTRHEHYRTWLQEDGVGLVSFASAQEGDAWQLLCLTPDGQLLIDADRWDYDPNPFFPRKGPLTIFYEKGGCKYTATITPPKNGEESTPVLEQAVAA